MDHAGGGQEQEMIGRKYTKGKYKRMKADVLYMSLYLRCILAKQLTSYTHRRPV